MNSQYNLQFDKLCSKLQLGNLISRPEVLSGGLLHKMFAIRTTSGKYAVKALNPQIMLRPTAMANYVNSELIASIASNKITAIPAKIFKGRAVQEIDGQYYLVFDWTEGKSLMQYEIGISHCQQVGDILADIHNTDFSQLGLRVETIEEEWIADWNYYLQKGVEAGAQWVCAMKETIHSLYEWSEQLIAAGKLMPADTISHKDLDSKNILWINDMPSVIDWEAAGFINSVQDLLETAIYWSKDESESINKEKLLAFIRAYKNKCPNLNADWKIALKKGNFGSIRWLEYNLKRSLGIECTCDDERKLGTEQVTETIKNLRQYADISVKLGVWLNNVI